MLRTPGGRNIFLKSSRKSTVQYNINTKEISALKFPLPPLPLQQTFATRIAAIEALKSTHRAALTQLDALFASLQHRAFSGTL
jgi:type I restriction enzyme, S subunit